MKNPNNEIYNFLETNEVLNTPNLTDDAIRNWGKLNASVYEHYNSYLKNIQDPNSPGPIEKHPYIERYKDDCDFQREFLILGTFPPSSYFNNLSLNNLPNPNLQTNKPNPYFYGNNNDLWYYLFELNIKPESSNPNTNLLQIRLNSSKISISDVFAYVQRKKMIKPDDSQYHNIVLNSNLTKIFTPESKIHTLLFTSGSLRDLLNNTPNTLNGFRWILEEHYNGLEHFTISGDIEGNGEYYGVNNQGIQSALSQQNDGIIWWLKFGEYKIRIINLPSPTPDAQRRMMTSPFFIKWANYKVRKLQPNGVNGDLREFMSLHPHVFGAPYTRQYRREVYAMVLDNTIDRIK